MKNYKNLLFFSSLLCLTLLFNGTQAQQRNAKLPEPSLTTLNTQTTTAKNKTTQALTKNGKSSKNAASTIDCNYLIPANQATIANALIKSWAQQAVVQTFSYNYQNYAEKLNDLKTCFTEEGWKSFSTALNKSGNINTVKQEAMSLTAKAEDEGQIIKQSRQKGIMHWQVEIPITVNYQGKTIKRDNSLLVSLSVIQIKQEDGQSKLGIEQLIAAPMKK